MEKETNVLLQWIEKWIWWIDESIFYRKYSVVSILTLFYIVLSAFTLSECSMTTGRNSYQNHYILEDLMMGVINKSSLLAIIYKKDLKKDVQILYFLSIRVFA